jgi:hypothetical protein
MKVDRVTAQNTSETDDACASLPENLMEILAVTYSLERKSPSTHWIHS